MRYLFTVLLFTGLFVRSHASVLKLIDTPKVKLSSEQQIKYQKNVVKFNPTALLLNNYSFSVERAISPKFSIQFGYRYQPYSYLFDNIIGREIAKRAPIDPNYYNFQTSNNTFTLDLKYYPKSQGLQGVYFGIYSRLGLWDMDNLDYKFAASNDNLYDVPLTSNFKGVAGGISIGKQWIIKKVITIEYYILAAHFGKFSGTLESKKDLSGLTNEEKIQLKSDVEGLYRIADHNYLNTVVNDKGITGEISGPFIGIRTGINVGFAF